MIKKKKKKIKKENMFGLMLSAFDITPRNVVTK